VATGFDAAGGPALPPAWRLSGLRHRLRMRVLFSHAWFYLDLYSDIIFSLVEIGRGEELCFRTGALVGTAAPLELFFRWEWTANIYRLLRTPTEQINVIDYMENINCRARCIYNRILWTNCFMPISFFDFNPI
jgi:hypothetical protein